MTTNNIPETEKIKNVIAVAIRELSSHCFAICKHFKQLQEDLFNQLSDKESQQVIMKVLMLDSSNDLNEAIKKMEKSLTIFPEES